MWEVAEKGFFYNDEVLVIICENMVKFMWIKFNKFFFFNFIVCEKEVL